MDSENKLQRQKKAPWSLGERNIKAKVTHLGEEGEGKGRTTPEREKASSS